MTHDAHISDIRVRHYAVQLAKGSIRVGLCLEYSSGRDPDSGELLDRSYRWRAFLNGEPTPLEDIHAVIQIDGADEPYVKGERITEAEYDYLLKDRAWAREHSPESPEANPRKKIDLNAMPVLF